MNKIRNLILLVAIILSSATLFAAKTDKDITTAKGLVERLIPKYADRFEFRKISTPCDSFTIESKKGKIIISGNNAGSMAVGLNRYLNRHCLTTVSWYADIPVEMPEVLPELPQKEGASARVDRRFFLNYCTYGYTMPFWDVADWTRMIDWMALQGINMPLNITGQEAVWYKVWRDMGMTDEETRSYFVGPAFLPWHRMANIDSWCGPLPMEWLEKQTKLQQFILERERDFGMKGVLPAFSGHVPAKLAELYPEANIKYLGKWAGFSDEYRCHFLSTDDPLFAKIQQAFLEEQTRLFGTDHVYGTDPFNEVDPPSWDTTYLKKVAHDIYATLAEVDPKAEWLQMSWLFYHASKKWTPERIKALMTGVPQGKMTLLDYQCENIELWRKTNNFHGQPFIWCYLGNFGGNTPLVGNMKEAGRRLDNSLIEAGESLTGIGGTLEGLDLQQFQNEYILDKVWTDNLPDSIWIELLADRHVGSKDSAVRTAWNLLFNNVYRKVPTTCGVGINYRPRTGTQRGLLNRKRYDISDLEKSFTLLTETSDASRDAVQIDIITTGRELLGLRHEQLKIRLDSAVSQRNPIEAAAIIDSMRIIAANIDTLNAYHPKATLADWINIARQYGDTKSAADLYEKNARYLITLWGGSLSDYASRTWSGLITDYYSPRWEIYFTEAMKAANSTGKFDESALKSALNEFENAWVLKTDKVTEIKPQKPFIEFVRSLR